MLNRDVCLAGGNRFLPAPLMAAVLVLVLGACAPTATPAVLPTAAPTQAAAQPTAAAAPTAAPATAEPAAVPTAEPTTAATAEPAAGATAEATVVSASPTTSGDVSETVSFASDVMPIFEERCIKCHGGERTRGGLDLKTHEALMKGGEDGQVIQPGSAADSMLVESIVTGEMPRREDPLTADQIAIIRKWVDQGAQNN